jgi:hypothetical protein
MYGTVLRLGVPRSSVVDLDPVDLDPVDLLLIGLRNSEFHFRIRILPTVCIKNYTVIFSDSLVPV